MHEFKDVTLTIHYSKPFIQLLLKIASITGKFTNFDQRVEYLHGRPLGTTVLLKKL